MKSKFLTLLFVTACLTASAQVKKIKRDDLLEINKDWLLIKTNSNTYGIMDQSGKVIVQPVYSKIDKFGEYNKNLALVKNVAGGYGFINESGREIIPAHHERKAIKADFSALYKKYVVK